VVALVATSFFSDARKKIYITFLEAVIYPYSANPERLSLLLIDYIIVLAKKHNLFNMDINNRVVHSSHFSLIFRFHFWLLLLNLLPNSPNA
jgi:hypothetical protein